MDIGQIYQLMLCPVCGFQLDFKPCDGESASDEICPCCGIQFGYDDSMRRESVYDEWRRRWIAGGRSWWGGRAAPPDFDPDSQLRRIAQPDSI